MRPKQQPDRIQRPDRVQGDSAMKDLTLHTSDMVHPQSQDFGAVHTITELALFV